LFTPTKAHNFAGEKQGSVVMIATLDRQGFGYPQFNS